MSEPTHKFSKSCTNNELELSGQASDNACVIFVRVIETSPKFLHAYIYADPFLRTYITFQGTRLHNYTFTFLSY